MTMHGDKPEWLTFDCYGTLIQWDEGLVAAVERILSGKQGADVDPSRLIHAYDVYEHELEQRAPHRSFRDIAGESLRSAMKDLKLECGSGDVEILTTSISRMPPFPDPTTGDLGWWLHPEHRGKGYAAEAVQALVRWCFDERGLQRVTAAYRQRNLVERFFNRLKQMRGLATRYDRRPDNFLAAIKLAAVRIWINA